MLAKRLQSLFLAVVVFALLLLPAQALADDGEDADLTSVTVTQQNVGQVRDLAASLASLNAQRFATRTGQFTWDTESKTRSWTYYNGIMMDAYLMLDSDTYLSQVNSFYHENISGNQGTFGQVDSTGASGNKYATNELDSIPPTRAMFDLLKSNSQEVAPYKDKYRATIDYVYSLLLTHKKADGAGGNFMHKMQNSNWSTYQVALDGLYMAQPFFMEVANLLDANDGTLLQGHFNQYSSRVQNYVPPESATLYREVYERMSWIGQNLYVEGTKLYSHGWGPEVPDDGLNHQYWLRAVGWYAAALADVISMMPPECAGYRAGLIGIETQLFEGMLGYQDPTTGMWYNVIDAEPGLQGSSVTNELESSGSALMAYAMMRSYSEGLVDARYGEAGLRAFNGTVSNMLYEDVVKNVRQLALHNVYKSSGVATTQEGYLTSTYEMNEAKGVGPLMMAAAYADAAAQRYAQEQPPAPAEPEFKCQTLLLSGQIGVNFYVDLSMLNDDDRTAAYMEFTVGDKTTTDTFDSDCTNPSTHEYYGFTCYINSVQMSDPITATLHYGDGQTVTTTYSAEQYVEAVVNAGNYSDKTLALVKAIADYGHYAQPFLAANNGWNLDTDHAVTAAYNKYAAEDVNAVKAAVAGNAFACDLGDSQIDKITYSLNFETETAIRIYLKMQEGYVGTPTAAVGGQSIDCVKQKDGRYRIEIAGISAHKLGDTYHVAITANGQATCDVSAFSYVRSALNSTSDVFNNDEAHFAVTALYKYYEAAINYKNNPAG